MAQTRYQRYYAENRSEILDRKSPIQKHVTRNHGYYVNKSRRKKRVHGLVATKEYYAWQDMKQRCLNPNNRAYSGYGGRGITVCAAWVKDFQQFLKDVGLAPSKAHTLGRKDNDRGYEPRNVRWETMKTQAQNRRRPTRRTVH